MLLALLVPIVASVDYAGGSLDDLIGFYTKHINKQIVIGVDADQYGPFKLVPEKKKSLSQLFSEAIKREYMDGKVPVFGIAQLPPSYSAQGYGWSPEPSDAPVASKAVKFKDDKFALDTIGKGVYPVSKLSGEKFSKPLKIHWFFDLVSVKGATDFLGEEEFLKTISFATLGTLKSSETQYEIVIDAKRFRKAYSIWAMDNARILQTHNDSYSDILKWKLTSQAILLCSDSQIESLMKTPQSSVYLKILPYGSCGALVKEYVRATFFPKEGEGGVRNPQSQILDLVDPLAFPEVVLRPRVPCGVLLRYRGSKGGVVF